MTMLFKGHLCFSVVGFCIGARRNIFCALDN